MRAGQGCSLVQLQQFVIGRNQPRFADGGIAQEPAQTTMEKRRRRGEHCCIGHHAWVVRGQK